VLRAFDAVNTQKYWLICSMQLQRVSQ